MVGRSRRRLGPVVTFNAKGGLANTDAALHYAATRKAQALVVTEPYAFIGDDNLPVVRTHDAFEVYLP